jgi:hypothetical protein
MLADRSSNIFESKLEEGRVNAFVNFDFSLHDTKYADLTEMFRQQLGWIKAESYVAENDFPTVVTTNRIVFAQVYEALRLML